MNEEQQKPTLWQQVRKLGFDLEECVQEQATFEAIDVVTEALQILMQQLDHETQEATKRNLDRLGEVVEARALSKDAVEVLSELLLALRADAPGTPLNNHKYDQLGIRAYAVIARAVVTGVQP